MDGYLSHWLRGDSGPGAAHGGDDPNEGLDGRPPPGGWQNIVPYEDANAEAAAANHGANSPGYYGPDAPAAGGPPPGSMPFDQNARAGNLYMGGFVPLLNYGWANRGNPGLQLQSDPNNPYAGYSGGMRRLDTGLSTLYGTPDPAGRQPAAGTPPAAGSTAAPGLGGAGEKTTGGGGQPGPNPNPPPLDDGLHRYLYGV